MYTYYIWYVLCIIYIYTHINVIYVHICKNIFIYICILYIYTHGIESRKLWFMTHFLVQKPWRGLNLLVCSIVQSCDPQYLFHAWYSKWLQWMDITQQDESSMLHHAAHIIYMTCHGQLWIGPIYIDIIRYFISHSRQKNKK